MFRKPWLILLGIIIIGFVIRIYKIQSLPMYGDELTMVYDIFSISKTGMDATGQKLPLTFKMGAGRPGGYIYFSLPFVAIFGPTVLGVRALSLLSGLGIVVLMYFLGKKLFNQKVGLIASLLMSISPWDIYLSRGGFEAHFALFLALLGIVLFLNKKYVFWAITWGITVFTYPTFKLTLPILFFILIWFTNIKEIIKNKYFYVGLMIILFFGSLIIKETLIGGSEQRFLNENMFADKTLKQNIIQLVNHERTISTLPGLVKPVFINQQIEYTRKLFENYVANLSPNFLVLRGDGQPRFNPGEMGMIYLIELPLIIISLFLLWKSNKRVFALLVGWLLIAPISTMFMGEPHALRSNFMLPPLILLSSLAISTLSNKNNLLVSTLILIQFIYIVIRVYTIAPAKFASFWSMPAKVAALDAITKNAKGEKVVLSITKIDNIEYAYEVYGKLDPKIVISQYGKLPKIYENVFIIDK